MGDKATASASLELDLTNWEKNWQSALDDTDTLTQALDDLSSTNVDVGVSLDMPDVSEFDEITALDGETITPSLDTQETESGKAVREGITFLATMEKIRLVIDIAGSVIDFLANTGGDLINPFLDIESIVSRINAQTGTAIPDLGDFIRDIQFADLGTSVDQIGDVVTEAIRLKAPLDEGTRAALTFTHTFDDQNPVTVLDALNTAATQFGISISAAGDLMTVFFQHGGNVGGDALQVVQANAQQWADMGLNLSQALSTVSSLQQGTGATAGDAAKMMQTFDDAMTAAAANPASQQATMLKLMGIDNPKDAGQAIGAETIDGFAAAFTDMPSDVQDQISGLFFGKGGKKFTGAIGDMSTQNSMYADAIGASADAATEIDNNLRGVIDDFVLAMNEKISDLLSSDAIDLPGKIADLKKGLQDGLAVLEGGGTIGDAIEVALNIPGFSDTIDSVLQNIERTFGQMTIAALEIVAFIQDPFNTTLQNADEGTRAQIHTLAAQQLPFDIKVANTEELPAIFAQAMQRGLTSPEMGTALTTALDELVAQGDYSKVQAIIGQILATPEVPPEAAQVLAAKYDALIADAQAKMQPQTTADATKSWWDSFTKTDGNVTTSATDAQTQVDTATTSIQQSWNDLDLALDPTTQAIVDKVGTIPTAVEDADARIATSLTDNTVTASFEAVLAAADTAFPGVIAWFERTSQAAAAFDGVVGVHLRSVIKQLNDLNFLAMVTIGSVTQAQALGGAGGTTVNNTNVTVNNNVPNSAAAAANGYAIGASLRPGGT